MASISISFLSAQMLLCKLKSKKQQLRACAKAEIVHFQLSMQDTPFSMLPGCAGSL